MRWGKDDVMATGWGGGFFVRYFCLLICLRDVINYMVDANVSILCGTFQPLSYVAVCYRHLNDIMISLHHDLVI